MIVSKEFDARINEAKNAGRHFGPAKTILAFLLVYFIAACFLSTALAATHVVYLIFIDVRFLTTEAEKILDLLLEAQPLFATVGTVIATIVYCVKIEKRSVSSMGLVKKNAFADYLKGLGIGFVMFFAVFLLLWVSGAVNVEYSLNTSLTTVAVFFIGFMIQGFSEEILLRGFCLVSLASSVSVFKATMVNSVLFSLLHIFNNGIKPIGLINIFIFGVFASLYFIKYGNLWGVSAIHTMWNFAQGNIFGFEVSGNAFGESVLKTEITSENEIITGGAFGPEGGLAVSAVLLVSVLVLYCSNKCSEKI